jgi:hypothetical protein
MIDTMPPDRERLDNLLADRALFGLSEDEQSELDFLLPSFPDTDAECFERIAASADLALGPGSFEPMPESLQAKVRQQSVEHFPNGSVLWPKSMGDL